MTRRLARARPLAALVLAALVLSGCGIPTFGAKPGATTSSHSVFRLWEGFSVGAIVIGVFVLLLIAWAVVKYRRKSPDVIPPQHQYHIPLEITYTVVPILIVFGLFAATLVVENKELANPPTAVTINVNAFQWGWKFTYPGTNVVSVGQTTQDPIMVMPVDTPVHINLTSSDVLHGFYVKAFNFSRYALPGVLNQFTFDATKTGTYFGQCTQLCGLYHSLMWFRVKVVSMSEYHTWLHNQANVAAAQASSTATKQQINANVPTKVTKSSGVN